MLGLYTGQIYSNLIEAKGSALDNREIVTRMTYCVIMRSNPKPGTLYTVLLTQMEAGKEEIVATAM